MKFLIEPIHETRLPTYREAQCKISPEQMAQVLDMEPNQRDSADGKATHTYAFKIGNKEMACWAWTRTPGYFSLWGDLDLWQELLEGFTITK